MPLDYTKRQVKGDIFVNLNDFPATSFVQVGNDGKLVPKFLEESQRIEFEQAEPSDLWEFSHDLGVIPFVQVYDTNNNNITSNVIIYADETIVRVQTENAQVAGRVEVYGLGDSQSLIPSNGLTWEVVEESKDAQPNTGYITKGSGSRIHLRLPLLSQVGDTIKVIGQRLWRIDQPEGISIQVGDVYTLVGNQGYIESTQVGDGVTLIADGAGYWYVYPMQGNIFVQDELI